MAFANRLISLNSLPTELLLSILSQVTLNGDLANLRLVESTLNILVIGHHQLLLQCLCSNFGLSERLLTTYFTHHAIDRDSREALMWLSREVSNLGTLYEDERRLADGDRSTRNRALSNLLWFSTFTSALKAGIDSKQTLCDILAPSTGINSAFPLALTDSFKNWLKEDLSLAELESVIAAINVSASKLWSSVFLYKAHGSRVNTFASLSGHTFNIEQAVLTEHVIWHGPRWAGRLLAGPTSDKIDTVEQKLHLYGPWIGPKEDGARIAANGLARMLWKERQRKVDEEREVKARQTVQTPPTVAHLPVNPVVWRGSSGDM